MTELKGNIQVYEKGGKRVIHEYFPSIHDMLKCLNERKNNEVMKHENSSTHRGDVTWYGTSSYDEAVNLLTCGYTDILDRIRVGITKVTKSLKDFKISKSQLIEDIQGASPIVPNYLQGLPKSMTYRKPAISKIKTINIIYCPCENAGSDPEEFINAGIAVLSAIRIIEKNNISVKLDCMFSDSVCDDEAVVGIVRIKNYRDRLDLQKLCFPLAHPSMLRRIGFKYLETAPDMKESSFSFGYGSTPDINSLENFLKVPDSTVLLNMKTVVGLKCDLQKVLEYINEKLLKK